MTLDILIENGRVVDGTGNPWFWADVGIKDGSIVSVGDLAGVEAHVTLDANGLIVCPGFIDIHTHSDASLLVNPRAESMVRQGVTTQLVGNCGLSCAPAMPESETDWHTFGEYLDRLEQQGAATNIAALLAQGQVREIVLGAADRPPTEEELNEMRGIVSDAMKAGAFGLSSGLAYSPGLFSSTEELVALALVAASYDGMYTTHIRDEASGAAWERSVQEAIEVSERAGIRTQISHIESHYPNWGEQERILGLIDGARARGLEITCDIPPYVCGSTALSTILPNWAHEGGARAIVKRLQDPVNRERVRQFILTEREDQASPTPTLLADGLGSRIWIAASAANPGLAGKSLVEIGEIRGIDPIEAALDLLIEDEGSTHIVIQHHSEEDIRKAVAHPLCMIVSDGWALAPYGELGEGHPHPRSYGVFPLTFRKYVRGQTREEEPREVGTKLITLQEALRKMTSFPAQTLGLRDRGLVREGMHADLVILDPHTIEDQATYAHPHQYPKGITYVLVNGQVVIDCGEHTGALPGQVLRGPGYAPSG